MFSCFCDSSIKLRHKQGVYKERKDERTFLVQVCRTYQAVDWKRNTWSETSQVRMCAFAQKTLSRCFELIVLFRPVRRTGVMSVFPTRVSRFPPLFSGFFSWPPSIFFFCLEFFNSHVEFSNSHVVWYTTVLFTNYRRYSKMAANSLFFCPCAN